MGKRGEEEKEGEGEGVVRQRQFDKIQLSARKTIASAMT